MRSGPDGAGAPAPLRRQPLVDEADFGAAAGRLAGVAGAVLGWSPDAFWRATPAEVAAVVTAIVGDAPAPPDRATLARLRAAFPDDGGVLDG